jgi:hypothetical protein
MKKGTIMENLFDEFSKSLAESVPRRESLRRLGAVFAGAVLGPLGLQTAVAAVIALICTTTSTTAEAAEGSVPRLLSARLSRAFPDFVLTTAARAPSTATGRALP